MIIITLLEHLISKEFVFNNNLIIIFSVPNYLEFFSFNLKRIQFNKGGDIKSLCDMSLVATFLELGELKLKYMTPLIDQFLNHFSIENFTPT